MADFPYMGPNLTPQELKALQAARAAGAIVAPLEGEYIPRGNPLAQGSRVAGLLGVDPVATQGQAARLGAQPALTAQGSIAGEAAQGARGAAGLLGSEGAVAGAEGAAGGASRGLLSRLGGAIFGPVGVGIQAAVTPGQLGNDERQRSPQEVAGINQDAQMLSNQVLRNVRGQPGLATDLGIMGGQPAVNPQATAGVAQEPGSVPAAQAMDARRATLERGAKAQLESNSLSRPEAAKAVVEADAARTGEQLSDKEKQARIKEETTAMRGMDNDSLSKYLSWALIGAGLVASAVDKSGMAGERFSESFNKQLDRNQQMALYQAQAKAKAEAAAAANALKEREISNKERGTQGNLDYQKGRLAQFADAGDLARAAEARKAQGMDARLGLQAAGLNLRQQELANMQDYRAAQLGIAQKKLGLLQQKAQASLAGSKAPELTTKSAQDMVSSYVKSQGGDITKESIPSIAEQVRIQYKANPQAFANDPGKALNIILSPYKGQGKVPTGLFGLGSGKEAYGLMKPQ